MFSAIHSHNHNKHELQQNSSETKDSQQYIYYLAQMIHSEPMIERCLSLVTSHVLVNGITCYTEDQTRAPTPKFQAFVSRYYVPFCRDAIRVFFMLGFVPWRIRRVLDYTGAMQKIPEVLPLGTFEWTVSAGNNEDGNRDNNNSSNSKQNKNNKRKRTDAPTTNYNLRMKGVKVENYHVYEYIAPDLTTQCSSPLSTLIPLFIRLQISRTCLSRAQEWNSSARFAVEHEERMQQNQLAEDGMALHRDVINSRFDDVYSDGVAEQTKQRAAVVEEQLRVAGVPINAHIITLPKNHRFRNLDPVATDNGAVTQLEIEFQRSVCHATGVSPSMVMQQYSLWGDGANTGGGATGSGQQLLQSTCKRVATALCELLREVYDVAYGSGDDGPESGAGNEIQFAINTRPQMPIGEIVEMHFRQLVDDESVNYMLRSSIGFGLSKGAERLPWNRTVQKPRYDDRVMQREQDENEGYVGSGSKHTWHRQG